MKTVRVQATPEIVIQIQGRFDADRGDTTTEDELKHQAKADTFQAMQDAAAFVRRVRQRLGLSKSEFSRRIHASTETLRNCEQGKRQPTGADKALFRY